MRQRCQSQSSSVPCTAQWPTSEPRSLSLHGKYGDVPAVRRLRNDLERLELDVNDVGLLPPNADVPSPLQMHTMTDEPYDPAMWADDADDEGLGGYHGTAR